MEFYKSYGIGALTVQVKADRFSLQQFHDLLNARQPGVKFIRDIVYNPDQTDSSSFLASTQSELAVTALAKLAKSYSLPIKSLRLDLQLTPAVTNSGDLTPDQQRGLLYKSILASALPWFEKNRPRTNVEPITTSQPHYTGPMVWDFGSRTSDSRLRIDETCLLSWYLRKEYCQSAWSYIQFDSEGGLEGIERAFHVTNATLASATVFGFELPGDEKFPAILKKSPSADKDFIHWFLDTVPERLIKHIMLLPADERKKALLDKLEAFSFAAYNYFDLYELKLAEKEAVATLGLKK